MPFTPFHLGFGILAYALLPFLDPIALLLGTILIDLEPLIHILFGVGALHGIFHSFLGVMVLFVPITIISWGSYKLLGKLFEREFKFNWGLSLLSSLLGLISHVLFDAVLYQEMMLFFPFSKKTGFLFGLWGHWTGTIILVVMFAVGSIILGGKFLLKYYKKKKKEIDDITEEQTNNVEKEEVEAAAEEKKKEENRKRGEQEEEKR